MARLSSAIVLALAGLVLAAAAPSGPDALPSLAAGVVGSGNQLSLALRGAGGGPVRVVPLGGEVIDGWVLSGLTNSVATLTRDGQSRTVGLNPAGAVGPAQTQARPTQVRTSLPELTPEMAAVLALTDEDLLARMTPEQRSYYDAISAARGLTAEEAKRLSLYQQRFSMLGTPLREAAQARAREGTARGEKVDAVISNNPTAVLLFGQDYADLITKQRQFDYQQYLAQYQAAVAAGVRAVWVSGQAYNAYPGATVAAGRSQQGALYIVQPPVVPGPVDQPYRLGPVPILTPELARILTGPDGAPVDPAAQAAALAANRQLLTDLDTQAQRDAATTFYGPFGVTPSPYMR